MSIKILTLSEAKETKARCQKYGECCEVKIGLAKTDYQSDNSGDIIERGSLCAVVLVLPSQNHPNYKHQMGMMKEYIDPEGGKK